MLRPGVRTLDDVALPLNVVAVTVLSNVAAPVTSSVPGMSTLSVNSTVVPSAAVCSS